MQIFAREAKPNRETYLTQDQCRESHYKATVANVTLPEDYLNPQKPIVPPDRVKGHASGKSGGTGHWVSEYKATSQSGPMEYNPPAAPSNAWHGAGRQGDDTSYTQEFGKYGSNPRDRLLMNREPGKLPVLRHALNVGTTKGTNYVPGYQGYIPFHAATPEAARALEGAELRSTEKMNLGQTFHVNLVGYAGHSPQSARNDRGGRKPSGLTTHGKDFLTPRQVHSAR